MRRVAVVLLVAVALAGCLSSPAEEPDWPSEEDTDEGSSGDVEEWVGSWTYGLSSGWHDLYPVQRRNVHDFTITDDSILNYTGFGVEANWTREGTGGEDLVLVLCEGHRDHCQDAEQVFRGRTAPPANITLPRSKVPPGDYTFVFKLPDEREITTRVSGDYRLKAYYGSAWPNTTSNR